MRPSAEASAAQRAHHTRTHLWNPESQQEEHKATIVARGQQQQMDAKPGAGRTRYRVGVRMAIISEDAARTGFEYDGVYQMHVPSEGGASCVLRAKNGAVLPLDGTMEVTELIQFLLDTVNKRNQMTFDIKKIEEIQNENEE